MGCRWGYGGAEDGMAAGKLLTRCLIGGEGGRSMDYVISFIMGGLSCAAVQLLLDRTKLMPGRVMVLLVCAGALLGFCGLYEPF